MASTHDYIISKGELQTPPLRCFLRGWGVCTQATFLTEIVLFRIPGLHVTSRQPCQWSRTGKLTLFSSKILRDSNFIVLTPNIAASSRGCKPRIPSTDKWYRLQKHTIVKNFASLLTAINTLSLN